MTPFEASGEEDPTVADDEMLDHVDASALELVEEHLRESISLPCASLEHDRETREGAVPRGRHGDVATEGEPLARRDVKIDAHDHAHRLAPEGDDDE